MHVARLARLADDAHAHPLADAGEVMMHRAHRQQHRHGDVRVVHAPVAQDDEVAAVVHGLLDLRAEPLDAGSSPAAPSA